MSQPALTSDKGVILTVGMGLSGGNRAALVIPVATPSSAVIPVLMCRLAVTAFKANALGLLQACFGAEGEVTFLAGEGMDDGNIPYREDYAPGTYVGTGGGGGLPVTNGLLLTFYEEPDDVAPGDRIRTAHNTIPGQSPDDWTDGVPSSAMIANGETFGNTMITGWAFDPAIGSDKWYRALAAIRDATGTPLKRIADAQTRGYVGTQRRRQIPH